jgi:hypothetical protein
MKQLNLARTTVFGLLLCLGVASAAWGEDHRDQLSSLTHLNGNSSQIVNLTTANCIPFDSSVTFFYDNLVPPEAAFAIVPQGFSFVITDIIITPCSDLPNQTDQFVVRIGIARAGRSFTAKYLGAITQSYHLTSGLVVPEGADLLARVTSVNSSDSVIVQLLGYFVRGSGLVVGEPFPLP